MTIFRSLCGLSPRRWRGHGAVALADIATAVAVFLCAAWFARCAWILSANANPDFAVVVTMARDIAAGRALPTFFYGQPYMGSLEPALSALFVKFFGPSPFVVCLGTALIGLSAVLATAALARRLAGPFAGLAALLLAAPGPMLWSDFLVSPRGGYALCALLCVAGLWLASGTWQCGGGEGRAAVRECAAFGFVSGLAWWNTWLALPSLFASGIVLLARLGREARRWCALAAGFCAFAISSAPWWFWNALHGWSSLATSDRSPAAPGLGVWRAALGPRLASFMGGGASASEDASPWSAIAVLAVTAALSALAVARSKRNSGGRRAVAAAAVHFSVFSFAYACTPFGAPPDSGRYFFALVPAFCLVLGIGLSAASALFPRGAARRIAQVAVLVALCASAARRAAVCLADFTAQRRSGERIESAASDFVRVSGGPGEAEPFYAAYDWFALNPASGGALVCAQPALARVPRFLRALEESDAPGVFADWDSFGVFLEASGGRAEKVESAAGLPLLRSIVPPPSAAELPPSAVASVRDGAGLDWTRELLDDNYATTDRARTGSDGIVRFDIELAAPTELCGAVLAKTPHGRASGWRAEAVESDGATRLLAEAPRMRDWHWSGPRFWQGGSSTRWELRWNPAKISALRLTFFHSGPDKSVRAAALALLVPDGQGSGSAQARGFAEVQSEAGEGLAALAATLSEMERRRGRAKLLADRWVKARVDGVADPSMDPLCVMPARIGEALDAYCRLDPTRRSRVVVETRGADAATRTLAAAGLVPEEIAEAGPYTVFDIPPQPRGDDLASSFFARGCVRFVCGRPFIDQDPVPDVSSDDIVDADFLRGSVRLLAARASPSQLRPGETVRLDLTFEYPRRGLRPRRALCVADFCSAGRCVFQGACLLGAPHLEDGGGDLPETETRVLVARVPDDIPPGDIQIRIRVMSDLSRSPLLRHVPGRVLDRVLPSRRQSVALPRQLRVGNVQ